MCGICGKLDFKSRVDPVVLDRMTDLMSHRGPDDRGVYIDDHIGLGHRRLSIIDLSVSGSQPMTDVSGRYIIAYNGEIYNFLELKEVLIEGGARFKSKADTEVVLEAYKRWGADCLQRFNGMFAFAIWDNREKKLFLARDRLGIKPLYYCRQTTGITFASEIKSILAGKDVDFKVSRRALDCYLSLNYIPGSLTINEGIKKLLPACYMTIDRDNRETIHEYWDLSEHLSEKTSLSFDDAAELLHEKLNAAVRRRLVSDVPLGGFLSGGIDSTAIASCMRRNLSSRVHTFSVGFREDSYSELDHAKMASQELDTEFYSKIVDGDIGDVFTKMVYHNDEPFADTSYIPMYYLSEFTREHVKVSLSGDGSDELFAGYITNRADTLYGAYSRVPRPLRKGISALFDSLLPVSFSKVSFDYRLRQFLKGSLYSPERAHYYWRSIFTAEDKARLYENRYRTISDMDPFDEFERHYDRVKHLPAGDQNFYVDIKTWLVDDILFKVDRTSMAHSLEVRVPFLDHDLVQFAASLPHSYRQRMFKGKAVLKKAVSRILPKNTIKRKKSGFNAPVAHWLLDSMKSIYSQAITHLEEHGDALPLSVEYVKELWGDHQRRGADNHLKLFSVLNLVHWHSVYLNN